MRISSLHRLKRAGLGAFLACAVLLTLAVPQALAVDKVLVLDSSVSGGAASIEATKAASLGFTVDVVDSATWSTLTAADFASYRAIILGDPNCGSRGAVAAAEANASVWGPTINGNVVVIGTDAALHSFQGGQELTEKGVAFAVEKVGKTGAYITLSCYYHGTAPNTPVPLLDGISPGGFTATGVGCFNDAHITATHPAFAGLTDADLSNWSCSVHEAFDKWPVEFEVLAIAEGIGAAYTAPDGTTGTPYIVARGVTVISDIRLAPESETNEVGTAHNLTATVATDSTPVAGATVTFSVIAGPHTGVTGTGVTGSDGTASFSYTGTLEGTDTIEATFVDSGGRTQRSNRVTKEWTMPTNQNPVCTGVGPNTRLLWPPNHKFVLITLGGATDPDGDPVTLTVSGVTQDEPVNGTGDGNTSPDAKSGPSSNNLYLRAERSGKGNGRVYRIAFSASDGNGGTCNGTVTVGVPHDQGKKGQPIDSGQSYNSFG